MSIPLPVMYPEDLSGMKASNLVSGEIKRPAYGMNQIIVPDHGPFFVEGLEVVDLNTGKPLAPTTQYVVAQFEADLSYEAGKEICSVIAVVDQTLNKGGMGYQLTYQTVGGPYSYSVQSIIDMIAALDLDNRPVEWKEILGKPDRFVPAPHPHNINDISGWSVLFPAFDSIRNAILLSDQAVLDALRTGFQAEIDKIQLNYDQLRQNLANHLNDFLNPHRLDIHDIHGLTAAEINQLLTGYLPIDGRAVNSLRLNGLTQAELRTWLVGTIQNSELVRGQFNPDTLATGWAAASGMELPIPTAKGWKNFPDLIAQFGGGTAGAYFAGATTAAQVAVTYSDNVRYPVGTLVTYHYNHRIGHGTGNGGTSYTNHNTRVIVQKYAPGAWVTVAAYQGSGYFYG